MNKYERAYLNVDTNDCTEEDCEILQEAIEKAEAFDIFTSAMVVDYVVMFGEMFDEKLRKKFTEWFIANIDKEVVERWLKDE